MFHEDFKAAKTKELYYLIRFYRDGNEIAVTYFRAGYTPNDYYSEKVISLLLDLKQVNVNFISTSVNV